MWGLRHPWSVVFLAGFIVYTSIRHVYQGRLKGEKSVIRRVDALEKTLLALVMPGSLLLPALYLVTPWLSFADYRPPAFVPWIGVGVMLPALWLFWRAHADLGRQWSLSLEIREGHRLVTEGVYRRMRHPMYLAIWLWSAAQACLLANWLAGFGALVSFAPMYFVRTPREEAMMLESFGDEYCNYMARTRRILPWPKRRA